MEADPITTSSAERPRRIAEAGFKDSAVKKPACFRRIRAFADDLMMATWPGRGSPPRFSTVRIRWLEKCPVLLGFSHVAIRWRRGRDSHPRYTFQTYQELFLMVAFKMPL